VIAAYSENSVAVQAQRNVCQYYYFVVEESFRNRLHHDHKRDLKNAKGIRRRSTTRYEALLFITFRTEACRVVDGRQDHLGPIKGDT
jgi:hypothetical protein